MMCLVLMNVVPMWMVQYTFSLFPVSPLKYSGFFDAASIRIVKAQTVDRWCCM